MYEKIKRLYQLWKLMQPFPMFIICDDEMSVSMGNVLW